MPGPGTWEYWGCWETLNWGIPCCWPIIPPGAQFCAAGAVNEIKSRVDEYSFCKRKYKKIQKKVYTVILNKKLTGRSPILDLVK